MCEISGACLIEFFEVGNNKTGDNDICLYVRVFLYDNFFIAGGRAQYQYEDGDEYRPIWPSGLWATF